MDINKKINEIVEEILNKITKNSNDKFDLVEKLLNLKIKDILKEPENSNSMYGEAVDIYYKIIGYIQNSTEILLSNKEALSEDKNKKQSNSSKEKSENIDSKLDTNNTNNTLMNQVLNKIDNFTNNVLKINITGEDNDNISSMSYILNTIIKITDSIHASMTSENSEIRGVAIDTNTGFDFSGYLNSNITEIDKLLRGFLFYNSSDEYKQKEDTNFNKNKPIEFLNNKKSLNFTFNYIDEIRDIVTLYNTENSKQLQFKKYNNQKIKNAENNTQNNTENSKGTKREKKKQDNFYKGGLVKELDLCNISGTYDNYPALKNAKQNIAKEVFVELSKKKIKKEEVKTVYINEKLETSKTESFGKTEHYLIKNLEKIHEYVKNIEKNLIEKMNLFKIYLLGDILDVVYIFKNTNEERNVEYMNLIKFVQSKVNEFVESKANGIDNINVSGVNITSYITEIFKNNKENYYDYSPAKLSDKFSLDKKANGGLITKNQIVEVGEGNKPEMIIPITRPARAIELLNKTADMLGLNSPKINYGELENNKTNFVGMFSNYDNIMKYSKEFATEMSSINNNSLVRQYTDNYDMKTNITVNGEASVDAKHIAKIVLKEIKQKDDKKNFLMMRNMKGVF